jgi:hypothetical protein
MPMMFAVGAAAQSTDSSATATLSDSGIVVRFPRFVSPDSITREMPVGDLFSGYEWRVVLLGNDEALVSALVIPPNDSLVIHRYATIKAAYLAGDLRSCRRSDIVLECDRPTRGLVRDVNGRLEIGIVDGRWITMALQSFRPVVRLIVKRARVVLWTADTPLALHLPESRRP